MQPLTHSLPPVAVARAAAVHLLARSLAERVKIDVTWDDRLTGEYGETGPAAFDPSQRLLNAASLGIAELVLANTPLVIGDARADVIAGLVKLGVKQDVAQSVVAQLVARKQLSHVATTPEQTHDSITALLSALQFKDGRLG